MEKQLVQIDDTLPARGSLKSNSLRSRADEVLIAIASLGLVAAIVDGDADPREIESFTRDFRRRFAISRRRSVKLISQAVTRIRVAEGTIIIDSACHTLNEHLDSSQKVELFEALADVLIADERIHDGEEYFLDYIIGKLDILQPLLERYPKP